VISKTDCELTVLAENIGLVNFCAEQSVRSQTVVIWQHKV